MVVDIVAVERGIVTDEEIVARLEVILITRSDDRGVSIDRDDPAARIHALLAAGRGNVRIAADVDAVCPDAPAGGHTAARVHSGGIFDIKGTVAVDADDVAVDG